MTSVSDIVVRAEELTHQLDLLQQIQTKAANAYIRQCIDDLAE